MGTQISGSSGSVVTARASRDPHVGDPPEKFPDDPGKSGSGKFRSFSGSPGKFPDDPEISPGFFGAHACSKRFDDSKFCSNLQIKKKIILNYFEFFEI